MVVTMTCCGSQYSDVPGSMNHKCPVITPNISMIERPGHETINTRSGQKRRNLIIVKRVDDDMVSFYYVDDDENDYTYHVTQINKYFQIF